MNKKMQDLFYELKQYLVQHSQKWNTLCDIEQYIIDLEKQLEEKDRVINEINKRCNQEINAAAIQYERHKRNDTWQYIIAHKRILEILERGKNDN